MTRLPDPVAGPLPLERRRCVRQKLHTPVYASFNGPETSMVVDLSELLDLHEEGFAVQTAERLEPNRIVSICLDLPETHSYVHGVGQVIWSDEAGRGGIKFSALPEPSRQILKQWLFANLLIASSNHSARTEQLSRQIEEEKPGPSVPESMTLSEVSDRTERLSPLDGALREIHELNGDSEAAFELIAEQARSLTRAAGAALALLTNGQMIWRSRSGEPAPPLGAQVDVNHGLSGECVRSGLLVSCENTEDDPRVDREIGRGLGIGSLQAVPIVSDSKVIGLLEIFSPDPHAFTSEHGRMLYRLGTMVLESCSGRSQSETKATGPQVKGTPPSSPIFPPPLSDEPEVFSPAVMASALPGISSGSQREAVEKRSRRIPTRVPPDKTPPPVEKLASLSPSRLIYRALLGLVMAVVAMVVGYLVGPSIQRRWSASSTTSTHSLYGGVEAAPANYRESATYRTASINSVPQLIKLADQGTADAQWQLAIRYHNGEGVPQDDTQAMKWFERAAEQGNVDAQSHLGAYYWAGRGVREDLSRAYFWSSIAMAQGDDISKARLEGLASQMTREQVSDARQQAEAWIHEHNFARTARN